jgi:uncharacterized protein YdeI (BOF family)
MKRFVVAAVIGIASTTVLSAGAIGDSDRAQVRSLHAQVITPASDVLFQAESSQPVTSAEWASIAARAADLSRAAQKLESIESAKGLARWLQFARGLRGAAEQAARAAESKNQDALVSANGDIVSVCEDCHTEYRDGGRSMKK